MSTKALKSQLLAAVAMVLVSSIALGSSTYAWFAMNKTVTATGMAVTTQVANNLFIADFTEQNKVPAETAFQTSRSGSITGLLEPVSTVNGVNYFYNSTKNVNGSGDAIADTYTAYSTDTDALAAFNTNYGTSGAVGYVDYVFCLKAVNSDDVAAYVNMTSLILAYENKVVDENNKAYRVAVFTEKANEDKEFAGTNTLLSILAPTGSAEFSDGKAISGVGAAPSAISTTVLDQPVAIQVAARSTEYYKVTVRMWLEGEDNTCNNTTFADLSAAWNLDMRFDFEAATGGVQAITKMATKTATDTGVKYYYDGTNYYNEIGGTALDGDNKAAAEAVFATP